MDQTKTKMNQSDGVLNCFNNNHRKSRKKKDQSLRVQAEKQGSDSIDNRQCAELLDSIIRRR